MLAGRGFTQDMHAIAVTAASSGYTVGELNPADSHGVFGERLNA